MKNSKCAGLIDDILKGTEFVTIVTSGEHGPYLVGNWGDHLRILRHAGDGDTIILPAGRYWQTEKNLQKNSRIAMMAASRHIHNMRGGQACVLYGRGEIVTSGPITEARQRRGGTYPLSHLYGHFGLVRLCRLGLDVPSVKAKFPWARGALLMHVEEASTQHT